MWHISWTYGSRWNRMSSRTVYLLKCIIFKCIINFLLRTSNSFKFSFFSQCVNPTVTNFRRQTQSRDTQINVQTKLNRCVYMCDSGWVLWLVNWCVTTHNAWNLQYDEILYISSYFRCYNQKVKHNNKHWVAVSL